jgi:hypothetical protein
VSTSDDSERWQPDEALVLTVRTRCMEMKELSGPDRSWVVASLTVQGWTVAAIAERLRCSLRLVQTIKTEPMTRVAMYALEISAQLAGERALRQYEAASAAAQAAAQQQTISRLSGQRDALLAHVQAVQRAQRAAVSAPARTRRTRSAIAGQAH